MKIKILALVLCLLLLSNGKAHAFLVRADLDEHTPTNAAIRSALIPGWGQYFNEQRAKGNVVFGVFLLTAIGAFYFNSQAQRSFRQYERLGIAGGPLFNDYRRHRSTSQAFTFVAIASYIYAVADAYFTARRIVPRRSYVFNIYYDPRMRQAGIRYGRKFNI
ncbi:MAG: DUF5683 domain-containing protein [Elusimicrobia bacterium]|nr:DUF5683 domain-containing protein [Elusimicrobiota bacterium]